MREQHGARVTPFPDGAADHDVIVVYTVSQAARIPGKRTEILHNPPPVQKCMGLTRPGGVRPANGVPCLVDACPYAVIRARESAEVDDCPARINDLVILGINVRPEFVGLSKSDDLTSVINIRSEATAARDQGR